MITIAILLVTLVFAICSLCPLLVTDEMQDILNWSSSMFLPLLVTVWVRSTFFSVVLGLGYLPYPTAFLSPFSCSQTSN